MSIISALQAGLFVTVFSSLALVTGCAGSATPQSGEEVPETSEALSSAPQTTASVTANGCTYTVGTTPSQSGLYTVYVQLSPVVRTPRACVPGTINLGTSYGGVQPTVIASGAGVAVAYGEKTNRTGTPGPSLRLAAVGAGLSIMRTGSLVAYQKQAGKPNGGTVDSATLFASADGTIVVLGTKNGVIAGEQGSGSSFMARFDKFTIPSTPQNPEPPTVVVAW